MVLVLACLGLKAAFLSRDNTVNYIVESLAFALRVPERVYFSLYLFIYWSKYISPGANLSVTHLFKVQEIIIPQICRIRNCASLHSILSFVIFPQSDTSHGMSLDFFDVASTDQITDGFRSK
jgi:hypothetical protein